MVATILIVASVACVFNSANGLSEPFPGFKPCKINDNDCALENAKKGVPSFADGIPELGLKRLDPVIFERVDASSPNLKFILSDITLTGLKTCVPTKMLRDAAKSQIELSIQCSLKLDGDYEMDGKILFIDLLGSGKVHIDLKSVLNHLKLNYIMKEGKDGKKYLRIKNFEHKYELKEKTVIEFKGLFKDNEVLRQATEPVIKENSNAIIEEIGHEMFKAALTRIVETINKFFGSIAYSDLILEA